MPACGGHSWHPRAPREHFRRVPKDVGTALTVFERIIVITLNSKINVTGVEAQRMRPFMTFSLGVYQQKHVFQNTLNPGKDNGSG